MKLIDADSIEKRVNDGIDVMTKIGVLVDAEYLWGLFCDAIHNAPTVDAEPVRHGHWIGDKCSACGEERAWYGCNPNWCPDCGAKMDESQSLFDKCVEDVGDWMKKYTDKMEED